MVSMKLDNRFKRQALNILLIGSGGREHALAWKISQSPLLTKLYMLPGNGGTYPLGERLVFEIEDHEQISDFCKAQAIDLVVIGPEAPLVDGLADDLRSQGIATFGPSAAAARLEGSKHFTKKLCSKMDIPTAAYGHFTNPANAHAYVQRQGTPIVIKADGLAAGKGVTIAQTPDEALAAIDNCFNGNFGDAGAEVVVEEFMTGEEASMFFLCDGTTALPFGTAQDHKAVGDGDTGPNTGGMGAYSPAPVLDAAMQQRVLQEIVEPTLRGMEAAGTPFSGVLYAGLIISDSGPKLIEYNVRFGDPECQVLMMRLESDLVPLLHACATGDLANHSAEWSNDAALTVVMAAKGYPGKATTGGFIGGLAGLNSADTHVFHAGTAMQEGMTIATGGRVLNITATGSSVSEAQARAYAAVDKVEWPDGFCRRDIGWRAIEREKTDG